MSSSAPRQKRPATKPARDRRTKKEKIDETIDETETIEEAETIDGKKNKQEAEKTIVAKRDAMCGPDEHKSAKTPSKLRVDNTTLTRQLRQVLLAGTNITFDTSQADSTSISASSGQNLPIVITNVQPLDTLIGTSSSDMVNAPLDSILTSSSLSIARQSGNTQIALELPASVVEFFKSSVVYTSANAPVINDGGVYSYDSSRAEFVDSEHSTAANYLFKYSPRPNSSALQTELAVSSASSISNVPWQLTSTASAPSASLSATLNGDSIYATVFSGTQDLSMAASQYANGGMAYANDYTVFLAGTFPIDQTASDAFFSLSGTSTIYAVSFGNTTQQSGALVYNLGESHYIPYVQATGVYAFRVSFTTAFTSLLDVFFNGHKIYSRAISTSLTAKSLGLGGLLSLGSSTNSSSFSMSLLSMLSYAQALSDQQCIAISKTLNFAKQVLPLGTSLPYPSYAIMSPPSNSATTITGSISLYGASPFDLHQATPANQPAYVTLYNSSIAFPTYNLQFGGAQANMHTTSTIPAVNSSVFGTFAIAYLPNVHSADDNEILTFAMQSPADTIALTTRYVSSTHVFTLLLNASAQCSVSIPHVASTNDELVLFLAKNETSVGLVIVRVDTQSIVGTCAFTYAGNAFGSLTIGRLTSPTSVFTYFLGDMWFYPRPLASYEYRLHTEQFQQLYGLPLVGSIFS